MAEFQTKKTVKGWVMGVSAEDAELIASGSFDAEAGDYAFDSEEMIELFGKSFLKQAMESVGAELLEDEDGSYSKGEIPVSSSDGVGFVVEARFYPGDAEEEEEMDELDYDPEADEPSEGSEEEEEGEVEEEVGEVVGEEKDEGEGWAFLMRKTQPSDKVGSKKRKP